MDIVLRATAMFAIMFALLRLLGKRELAQMTPFEMVMLVVMGDLIQQGVTHNDFSLTGATLAIGTFAFWGLVMNWLSYRSRRFDRWVDGEPTVIVRNGELLEAGLRCNRLNRTDVDAEMRLAGIAHLTDVQWAVVETNGKISFIEKDRGGGKPAAAPDDSGAAH